MDNARRRRELLVLTAMLGMTIDAARKFPQLAKFGPYVFLENLEQQFSRACPGLAERQKELRAARMVVNLLVPSGFEKEDPMLGLMFVSMATKMLVNGGYRVPKEPVAAQFVQALYTTAEKLDLPKGMPEYWRTHLELIPGMARANNLFDQRIALAT